MYEIPTLEVYLDILFILNFVMDYFIFWMVSKITYQKISRKRLCIGSFIAALLYCLVVISPFLRTINIGIYLVLLPLIPIKIIFKPTNIKQFIQTFIIANITALIVGGMNYGIFYWVEEQDIVSYIYQKTYKKFSIWILLFSIFTSYIIIQLCRYYIQKRNTGIQRVYSLEILYNGQKVCLKALLDTGNKVYDPITKHPVIIVEYKILEPLLPENIRDIYFKGEEDITHIVQEAGKCSFGTRIRLIPYHSLGNPNGILLGFKPDEICIGHKNCQEKPIKDVIIAIYQHDLTMENTYHGLLHADLIS